MGAIGSALSEAILLLLISLLAGPRKPGCRTSRRCSSERKIQYFPCERYASILHCGFLSLLSCHGLPRKASAAGLDVIGSQGAFLVQKTFLLSFAGQIYGNIEDFCCSGRTSGRNCNRNRFSHKLFCTLCIRKSISSARVR